MKFTRDHEWVRLEGHVVTIGITAHAAEALGDVVFVEVPEAGRQVVAGDSFAVVESVKAASDVYAPVTGEVVEVNTRLKDKPEDVNGKPHETWMVKVKLASASWTAMNTQINCESRAPP